MTKLPGLFDIADADIPLMFAGQLELYKENKTHYFFWKFVDQHKLPEAENKTIFWLNGGPGCSSMDGALMEAGPLRVNKDKNVVYNDGSWHKKGDIVFVDQPANTGFSYSDGFALDLNDVSWHFVRFLQKYFELFPEDAANEIIFAGESYAGQYIPYIAQGILDYNNGLKEGQQKINLKGLLIGNGWISPGEQSLSYLPFAVKAGMISTNHPNWKDLQNQHVECQNKVAAGQNDPSMAGAITDVCDRILNKLLLYTRDNGASKYEQCFNMYDYTLKDSYPSCGMNWPPDLEYVTPFLRQEDVMSDLNLVNHRQWRECGNGVRGHLSDNFEPSIRLLPGLLEQMVIVLFHGNRDIICNYIGGEDLVSKLSWNGHKGYSEDVITYDWVHDNAVAGYIKNERNLTFINVFDASHMVPFDKPEISRALVDVLYSRFDVDEPQDGKPSITTHPVGYVFQLPDQSTDGLSGSLESGSLESGSVESGSLESGVIDVPGNSTLKLPSEEELHQTSRAVRLIQFAVIAILIWGICALYSTYRSKPTSIIKTKSSGRKKNVQWADQLEEDEAPGVKSEGIFAKALNKLKRSDERGAYAPTSTYEDIEMADTSRSEEDFIISSDDERV